MNKISSSFGHAHAVAQSHPDKIALRFEPSGRTLSFGQLERESNRHAHALRAAGLKPGEAVALCYPNSPELLILIGAAARLGLYYTLLPYRGSAKDLAYIITNSGARVALVATNAPALANLPALLDLNTVALQAHTLPGSAPIPEGFDDWQAKVKAHPDTLPDNPAQGREMLYSSGSTGRPKGIRKPLPDGMWNSPDMRNVLLARASEMTSESVYLSTSPLYHSAPNRYQQAALSVGALSVVMENFDPEQALRLIDREHCTHSLWVPTMFQRMLRLEPSVRSRWSMASMTHAVHGAAPCPIHVKQAMIDWWGPVLYEYYAGTEGLGSTWISTPEWLTHKGSVGCPRDCRVHILDEHGIELPIGTTGTVYFESLGDFSYWKDPQKTQEVISPQGWRTFGDVGHVDAEGYLYLTDRRDFMVISGGVNLYPQEIESALLEHPAVVDAAAFGVPDEDLGEKMVAVVQLDPAHPASATPLLDEIKAFSLQRLGHIKAPKQIAVIPLLPRLETGKLHKKRLQADWLAHNIASSSN